VGGGGGEREGVLRRSFLTAPRTSEAKKTFSFDARYSLSQTPDSLSYDSFRPSE